MGAGSVDDYLGTGADLWTTSYKSELLRSTRVNFYNKKNELIWVFGVCLSV